MLVRGQVISIEKMMNQLLRCCIATLFFCVGSTELVAQSTVVEINSAQTVAYSPARTNSLPRSSANGFQSRVLETLNRIHDGQLAGVMRVEQLLGKMNQIGLPADLDYSAIDDSLTLESVVEIPSAKVPIGDLLENILNKHNATLAMVGNRLGIISRDVATDVEHFLQLTYDISFLTDNSSEFVDVVKRTIDPEGWDETNGDGSIAASEYGGRRLISVAQTLRVHRAIQDHMTGLSRLSGAPTLQTPLATYAESRIITLPSKVLNPSFGGDAASSGIGGYGLGGGIF